MRGGLVLICLLGLGWGQEMPLSSVAPPTPPPELLQPDSVYPFLQLEANRLLFAEYLRPLWQRLAKNTSKVRVLHLSDTPPSGEWMGKEIRRRLYKVWGAGGRGFVFPYQLAGMGAAYDYISNGDGQWLVALSAHTQPALPLGGTGIGLATYDPTAQWELKWSPAFAPAAPEGARLRLLIRSLGSAGQCVLTINDTLPPLVKSLQAGYQILDFSLPAPLISIRGGWQWRSDASQGYGELQGIFIEEGERGITWYSVSLPRTRAGDWANLPLQKESLRMLAPDLIVIDLGTAELMTSNPSLYEFRQSIEAALDTIRQALPQVSILLVSPQDFYKGMRPFPIIEEAAQVIRWIGAQKGAAVWDAYTALGSIRDWRLAGLAAADMIYLSPAGYILKGQMLASAFLGAYQAYLKGELPALHEEKAGVTLPSEALRPAAPQTVPVTPSITQLTTGGGSVASYKPKPPPAFLSHTVRMGETLSQIAQKYGTTVYAIQQANGLRGSTIRPGQVLKIPTAKGGESPTLSRPQQSATPRYHTVRTGESLWSIAQKYGTTVEALAQANGISPRGRLHPGQKLRIP